jgi:4-amino-4-deoxy-L-arabinose transferase-like glycosyltransferase
LIARAGRRGRVSLGLVMAGVVAFAVADSAFSYLTEVNSYGGGSFLDTGWVAGYLLIALGALWAMTSPLPEEEEAGTSAISLMAPYVPVLVVLAVTAIELLRGRHIETVAWVMAFVLALLVLGREVLRLWDQSGIARLNAHSTQPDVDRAGLRDQDARAALQGR